MYEYLKILEISGLFKELFSLPLNDAIGIFNLLLVSIQVIFQVSEVIFQGFKFVTRMSFGIGQFLVSFFQASLKKGSTIKWLKQKHITLYNFMVYLQVFHIIQSILSISDVGFSMFHSFLKIVFLGL